MEVITQGLLKFLKTRGQLAGVLSHEIGHVVARHSAQHLAKQQLTQGLTGAAVVATYDPNDPKSRGSAEVAMLVASLLNLKFNRNDELEAEQTWCSICLGSRLRPSQHDHCHGDLAA